MIKRALCAYCRVNPVLGYGRYRYSKYCSAECGRKAQAIKIGNAAKARAGIKIMKKTTKSVGEKVPGITRVCPQCGREYRRNHDGVWRKYCSKECAGEAKSKSATASNRGKKYKPPFADYAAGRAAEAYSPAYQDDYFPATTLIGGGSFLHIQYNPFL